VAPWIERVQLVNSSIYACGLRCSEEPHIYDDFSKIGYDVGTGASGDEAGIEGKSLGGAGERGESDDLVSGLQDGRGTALEIESGVCGKAMNSEGVAGYALA
jgi:hypothetical protein